ncbi:Aldo/keto reductase [Amylostereum chailletii]|nr:Aldo/keto reductase [Amylostereum chailletii]
MSLTITSTVKLRSGNAMPLLGLGVYRNEDCAPACLAALKHGYRHIDSAEMYQNEAEVGRAVRESGVSREQVFITSKVPGGTADPVASVQASYEKLNVGHIDLYLIHSAHGGKDVRLNIYKALLAAKVAGKVRDVGVSNFNIKHLEELREAGLETPAVNQVELHPFCQQKPIVDYCSAHGIVVEAYCPLVRGAFDNPVLQEISKKTNKTPAQVLVRWSLQSGFVPLPKSSNPERVIENANIYDFVLSPDEIAALNALDRGSEGAISWNPIDVD